MKRISLALIMIFSINAYSQSFILTKQPLQRDLNCHTKTSLTTYLNEVKWNKLFPNRHGFKLLKGKKNTADFYSFKAFVTAAKVFPEFLAGDVITQKQELSAFLANIAQETSGGWTEAPGGYFKWGLYKQLC